VLLFSCFFSGCSASSKPYENGSGDDAVYSWVRDTEFSSLSNEQQRDAIIYDILFEEGYDSSFYIDTAVGQDGSIYVIGGLFAASADAETTAVLIRYDSDLNILADVRKPHYSFSGIAIDSEGNVYATGAPCYYRFSEEYRMEFFHYYQSEIIKYNFTLEELAVVELNDIPVDTLESYSGRIAIAPDGSVYVAAYRTVVKLDNKLVTQVAVTFESDLHSTIGTIAIAPDGAVFVIATQFTTADNGVETMLLKYNANLVLLNEVRKNEAVANYFWGLAIAADGSAYTVLYTHNEYPDVNPSGSVIRFDSNLTEIDSVVVDSLLQVPGGYLRGCGWRASLTVDDDGFVYMTSGESAWIVLFDSDLTPLNVVCLPLFGNHGYRYGSPRLLSVAIALDGAVYSIGEYRATMIDGVLEVDRGYSAGIIVK